MIASPTPLTLMRAFARDSCGAAGIELALGATVLLSVSALCFDLYARIKADTAAARMAVTMADYVSRDANPDGDEMEALGRYLHRHELGVPADLVYVITALHQPPGDSLPAVACLWSDASIRIGDTMVTTEIASGCPQFIADGGANLPDGFTMLSEEIVVIAEVCARLTREGSLTGKFVAGDIYRLHALPARKPGQTPARPAYADPSARDLTCSDPVITSFLDADHRGGAGTAIRPPSPLSTAGARA